jgi:proline iminopeptidase
MSEQAAYGTRTRYSSCQYNKPRFDFRIDKCSSTRARQPKHWTVRMSSSRTRAAGPPLCMTGVLCDSRSVSVPSRGKLHFTVFRPRSLQTKPVLVCISGGPLLASSYLNPIVHGVTDRSVVLYDAIGCGSSQPTQASYAEATEIGAMVQDFSIMMDHLPCVDFYLLGHSFGGLIAYEYVKRRYAVDGSDFRCRGVILVSTPVSLEASRINSKRLMREIEDEIDDSDDVQTVKQAFHQRHECRVTPIPLPLQTAVMNSPMLSQQQRHQHSYQATGESASNDEAMSNQRINVPLLVLRGEYDFCPEGACREWLSLFTESSSTYVTLAGCSHYSMLENDSMFARAVASFLQEWDSKTTKSARQSS